MKEWLQVACTQELPLGGGKTVQVNGKRFAIFHLQMGYFALDGRCLHPDGHHLGEGKIQDHVVVCLEHGCRFNIVSGECLDNKDIQLGTYRVKTQGSSVFIQLF